jgi:hypothetical protein
VTDQLYLVCPGCEHTEQWCRPDGDTAAADPPAADRREQRDTTDGAAAPACPACGSDRAYLHHAPALPDPATDTDCCNDLPVVASDGGGDDR